MRFCLLIAIILISGCADKLVTTVKTIPVKTSWSFAEYPAGNYLPATVPGVVQMDLYRNQQIENPVFENNEQNVQWVSDKNWIYKTSFTVTDSLMKFKAVDLLFEGIDTYAGIYVNDSLLVNTNNMFRSWRVNAKPFLHAGTNELKVVLYAPAAKGESEAGKLNYKLPNSDTGTPGISPFIRKAGYHFGWDWSPRFLTMGIYKPLKIIGHDKVYISNVHVRTVEIADTCAWLSADVTITSATDHLNSVLTVRDAFKPFRLRKGENVIPVTFKIFNPELWWPNGYGKQPLYDLTAKLYINGYLVDSAVTQTGIRTIELNQDEDEWGRSFYFRVNGLPIFMKGANYVPQSNFVTEVSASHYEQLINDAAAVGMNMLRVWGGGIYENDVFYKLCNQKGILVWQDFMFANAMYPGDEAFKDNVTREVEGQVTRLRNHPCIALWCGNNEIEVAWKNWGWQQQFGLSKTDSAKVFHNYKTLFDTIVPAVLTKLDASRPYLASSPVSNWGKMENFSSGNMHYWGVWHGNDSIEAFRNNVPRFMTEYGMQSYPSFSSLKKNTVLTRITLNSVFIKNRQKSYKGNTHLLTYVEDYFGKVKNAEDLCYLSQLNQAEAMRIAIESHRRDARFCMGSLYWQLNDVWDGASWSTLEHHGKWKAAHFALKRLYYKDIVFAETVNDTVRVYFQTENTNGRSGFVTIKVMDFKGRMAGFYKVPLSAGYLVSDKVFEKPLAELINRQQPSDYFLVASVQGENQDPVQTIHCFRKPVALNLPIPAFSYQITPTTSGADISITSDVFAKGVLVELEKEEGLFSDNYFDLLPGVPKIISCSAGDISANTVLKISSYRKPD